MVMQPTADFLVGGSNPGRANMAAALAMTVDRQGFEPPTQKSAARCVTIEPGFVVAQHASPLLGALKNPLGDCLIGQNNDFTRGWTSNIMPWGMLRE